jgi:hypothetical protein
MPTITHIWIFSRSVTASGIRGWRAQRGWKLDLRLAFSRAQRSTKRTRLFFSASDNYVSPTLLRLGMSLL